MIDSSGLVVMGVGLVSAIVVNLFVAKNNRKCPKTSTSLQAYSGPDEFPLPIPDSIYGSENSVKVEPEVVSPKRGEGLKATTLTKNIDQKKTFVQSSTSILNEPSTTMARSLSDPFLRKVDVKGSVSRGSVAFMKTSKLNNLESPPERSPQGDQTVTGSVKIDDKTEDTSTSEEISQGDSISKDLPKDLSSYSSTFSWEDAFVEREPFVDPRKDFSKPDPPHQKSLYTKNKTSQIS